MRLLVTGGAGYIGSIVAAELIERGHHVAVLDNLSSGHRQAVPREAELLLHDLSDKAGTLALLEQGHVDAVLHFAANIQVGESVRRPLRYLGDNVRNALDLLECMTEVEIPRFIFSSTAAIFAPSESPIAEDSPIGPASPYGESKYMIERALRWLDETRGLRFACLRYFNAAGAWGERGEAHPVETHLIPLVLAAARGEAEDIAVYGDDYPTPDGTCVRDYVHVRDLAEAHILALEALDGGSRAYNLGNGRGFSVREVIDAARHVTGRPIPERTAPRRPGDSPWLVADSAKIMRELGWEPRLPHLESIISTAWEWHQSHPRGYED